MTKQLTYIHQFVPGQGEHRDITLLLLHGTGGNENSLSGLGRMLLPDAAQLRLRGSLVEDGRARFFRRFADGVLDREDLARRILELTDFLQRASQVYDLDLQKMVVAGFSNGANMAVGMLLDGHQPWRAAVLLHSMLPFQPESLPDLRDASIFLGAGREDPLVPTLQTQQLSQLLEQAGARVELFSHNGGHTISLEEVKQAKKWLANLVAPGASAF